MEFPFVQASFPKGFSFQALCRHRLAGMASTCCLWVCQAADPFMKVSLTLYIYRLLICMWVVWRDRSSSSRKVCLCSAVYLYEITQLTEINFFLSSLCCWKIELLLRSGLHIRESMFRFPCYPSVCPQHQLRTSLSEIPAMDALSQWAQLIYTLFPSYLCFSPWPGT